MAIDTSRIRQERAQFSMGAKRERGKGYLFPNGIYYARGVAICKQSKISGDSSVRNR